MYRLVFTLKPTTLAKKKKKCNNQEITKEQSSIVWYHAWSRERLAAQSQIFIMRLFAPCWSPWSSMRSHDRTVYLHFINTVLEKSSRLVLTCDQKIIFGDQILGGGGQFGNSFFFLPWVQFGTRFHVRISGTVWRPGKKDKFQKKKNG